MRKMLDIDPALMEGFQFDPVPPRIAVTKAEVLAWADKIENECTKVRVCADLALMEMHQRKFA